MMQSYGAGAGVRLRRLAALAPLMALLSGCGFSFSLLPTADEADRAELTEWQQKQLLAAPLGALPQEVADALPDEHVADASRFLTRALETTPDGQRRRWRSLDRKAVLTIRPTATVAAGGSICREAVLRLESPENDGDYGLRVCRLKNGTWTQ